MVSANCESCSKCTGACVKDAPALSLTPGTFLPLLVLMLSLQIWLNITLTKKKKKDCSVESVSLSSSPAAKSILKPKKVSDENCNLCLGGSGRGAKEGRMSTCSRGADKLKAIIKLCPLASSEIFRVTACWCCFRKMLLKQTKNSPRSLDF